MEAQDPLSQLADIHLPATVGFWPPAPGWWILAAALIIGLLHLCRVAWYRYQLRRRRQAALDELARIVRQYQEKAAFDSLRNQAGLDFLKQMNTLLKRVGLAKFPRQDVASLSGDAWLAFLDACDQTSHFRDGPGKVLGDGVYRRNFEADPEALQVLVRHWVENRYRTEPRSMAATRGEVAA